MPRIKVQDRPGRPPKPAAEKKKPIMVHFLPATVAALQELAAASGRSQSVIVEEAFLAYLRQEPRP